MPRLVETMRPAVVAVAVARQAHLHKTLAVLVRLDKALRVARATVIMVFVVLVSVVLQQ